jgi:hypothetical protein
MLSPKFQERENARIYCLNRVFFDTYFLSHPDIGQFSSDLAPVLQLESSDIVLPALIHVIANEPNVRVRAHAMSALSNFRHVRSDARQFIEHQ